MLETKIWNKLRCFAKQQTWVFIKLKVTDKVIRGNTENTYRALYFKQTIG